MFGYHGRYLRIDLGRQVAETISIDERILRRYLGGVGLGTLLALYEGAAEADPLDASNVLVFAFSALVGSPLTTSAKFAVVSKSPLTLRLNDALASSAFALAGKACGVDAIAIRGRSCDPIVLIIDDGQVTWHAAQAWWELPVSQLQERLRAHFGPSFRWAVIGPAGCRGVRFATISHDGRHAGRGGLGAVLGAKRVLAVGVRGRQATPWAHPQELFAYARTLSAQSLGPATAKYRELGTVANLVTLNRLGALPSHNFRHNQWTAASAFAPDELQARRRLRGSCAACTIGCEHIFVAEAGGQGDRLARVEYENLFALGPLCGVEDVQTVLEASRRCDEAGMDTLSAGGTIALAMECVERGWLELPWLGFGNSTALLRCLEAIAERAGWGYWLGEGSRRLAEYLGGDAPRQAMHVKGLELPGYDPRTMQTLALGLATAARGADHNRTGAYEIDLSDRADRYHISPEHARWAVETEDTATLLDSLILCKFLRGVFADLWASSATILQLVTGWNITTQELKENVQRIITLKKYFNMRSGWSEEEDDLPPRFFEESASGTPPIARDAFRQAVRTYYQLRGWDEHGVPSEVQRAEIDADLRVLGDGEVSQAALVPALPGSRQPSRIFGDSRR